MVRVLQLLAQPTEFQAGVGAELIAKAAGDAFEIFRETVGQGGTHRGFLSAFISLFGALDGEFDVVHVWDPRALEVALLAGARRVVFSPSSMPSRLEIQKLGKCMRSIDVRLICCSAYERRAYIECGIDQNKTLLAPPGVAVAPNSGERNAALRAELGFAQEDYVLLAPGESALAAGHREAVWTVGILAVLDPRYKLLTWGRGPLTNAVSRLAKKIGPPGMATGAEQKLRRRVDFAALPGVCDAALFAPAGPTPTLAIAICLAAGMPIIASPMPGLGELLDHQMELVAPRLAPRILAQRVLELRKNPALHAAISHKAREKAKRLFDPVAHCEIYKQAYRELAGRRPG